MTECEAYQTTCRRTLTSAWIETYRDFCDEMALPVALSRVRGLKPWYISAVYMWTKVALSRVRGLKLNKKRQTLANNTSHSHECVD